MKNYTPYYDPPLEKDRSIFDLRVAAFEGRDKQIIQHIGHFIGWYAHVENSLTWLLHVVTEQHDSAAFHVLTRGLDARGKVERIKEAGRLMGYPAGPGFDARLNHFLQCHVNLRNKLVHNHLYWPPGSDELQIATVASPPLFPGSHYEGAPEPERVEGIRLFEHGLWLCAFGDDLAEIHPEPHAPQTLEIAVYRASLPKGHQPRQPGSTRHAKRHKPPRKRPAA